MDFIKKLLEKISHTQTHHKKSILTIAIVVTLFLSFGFAQIYMQTDMMEEMPQDLPIFILNDKITNVFGGDEMVVIITQLDTISDDVDGIKDIRNPQTIKFIQELEYKLLQETDIDSVISINTYLRGTTVTTQEQLISFLTLVPAANNFFSEDYMTMITYIKTDVGSNQDKLDSLVEIINQDMDLVSNVPGAKNYITGTPVLNSTLGSLMLTDALYTISIALILIFILLIILKKSLIKAIIVTIPLILGLIWTVGILGYLNIPITMATAGIGAMILGLGVEYSIFVFTRYIEERDKGKTPEESLKISTPSVGQAIIGSSLTTLMGFLALTLSTIPMLQKLGLTLAIGIFSILIATIVVSPVIFMMIEKKHILGLKKTKRNHFTNK